MFLYEPDSFDEDGDSEKPHFRVHNKEVMNSLKDDNARKTSRSRV